VNYKRVMSIVLGPLDTPSYITKVMNQWSLTSLPAMFLVGVTGTILHFVYFMHSHDFTAGRRL
jgi:heme/copper-type cytochrome/quinol oxidase subunit 4